jgi:hypothetical protein
VIVGIDAAYLGDLIFCDGFDATATAPAAAGARRACTPSESPLRSLFRRHAEVRGPRGPGVGRS